jgi:hypothetical protein
MFCRVLTGENSFLSSTWNILRQTLDLNNISIYKFIILAYFVRFSVLLLKHANSRKLTTGMLVHRIEMNELELMGYWRPSN